MYIGRRYCVYGARKVAAPGGDLYFTGAMTNSRIGVIL
jgi:hypothetical protein